MRYLANRGYIGVTITREKKDNNLRINSPHSLAALGYIFTIDRTGGKEPTTTSTPNIRMYNVNELSGMLRSTSLSVQKHSVPEMLAFAFASRLRSKMGIFGRRLRNGKPQERLRFRDLRGKTQAFKKHIAIISCVLEASLGARVCVQVLCIKKNAAFCVFGLKPLRALPLDGNA